MAKTRTPARPRRRAPSRQDVTDEVFDGDRQERLDASSIEAAFQSLLDLHSNAQVVAVEANGSVVPVPASLGPCESNVPSGVLNGMELIAEEDRARLFAVWDRVMVVGAARCPIHLADDARTLTTWCGFDLREKHGTILVVMTPADEDGGTAPDVNELPQTRPRFATIYKNEISVVTGVSETFTELLGWSVEEVEGHRSVEFMHPDDHPLAVANWIEMIAAPGPARRVRIRHRHKDGSWVWFELTNHNLLEDPAHKCVVCEMVDISEEMAAHEEVRAHEQLLDQLAEAMPLGLFKCDHDRQILYTNARLHEILGCDRTTTVSEQLAGVVPSDWPAVEQALKQVLRRGAPVDIEVELLPSPGAEPRCCAINFRALRHADDTISGAIACVADVTDTVQLREELEHRATYDMLTGCLNRSSIMRALESQLSGNRRKSGLAVMFLDLDEFKETNDTRGHVTGDRLLSVVAKRLRESVRDGDLVGRIGGDEFLVVCPSVASARRAEQMAKRIAETLGEKVRAGRATLRPRVSIGTAWSDGGETDADTLVVEADRAMYEAKRSRRAERQAAARAPRRSPRARRGDLHATAHR